MDRLTYNTPVGAMPSIYTEDFTLDMDDTTYEGYRKIINKLAHYEDLEKAGREVYVAVVGNYALNNRIFALSSLDLAEKFRNHMWKEGCDECINIFKVKIDDVVLKEEDL